jgi:hypothetical protein
MATVETDYIVNNCSTNVNGLHLAFMFKGKGDKGGQEVSIRSFRESALLNGLEI